MADITLSYKGNTIATMSASGTKTIQTKEKYCEDDINLAYVKDESSYNILKGSAQPAVGIGQDGDVYLQYAALDGKIVNTYVKVSGAWVALVGSDVDDVSNSGMYTGTDTPPPASLGSDGDYYYQRGIWLRSIQSINAQATIQGSNVTEYGAEFTVNQTVTVTHLFARTTETRAGKLQIGTTSQILAETENASFPANTWIEVPLPSPIQLFTDTNYIVKAVIDSGSFGRVAYVQGISNLICDSKFSYVGARHGSSWPGTSESGVGVMVGAVYLGSEGVYEIRKQYHKVSGSWSEIT